MKLKFLLLIVIFFNISFPQNLPDSLIKKMMITTGTISSLEDIIENLQKDIFRFSDNATNEDSELVKNEVRDIFNIDTLTGRYIKNFKIVYNEKNVKSILDVYRDPVYIKATKLESREIPDEEIEKYLKNYNSEKIASGRLELINRLKNAARVSDFSYYSLKSTLKISLTVSNSLSGSLDNIKTDEMVDLMLKEAEPEMDNFITIFLLQCYEELSDDELEEYVDYYESDLGKWHTEASITSYLNTLTESANIFSDTFPAKTRGKKI
jgi:hypothetical protein